MKRLSILFFLFLIAGCSKKKGAPLIPGAIVSVVHDLNDKGNSLPVPAPITLLYHFENHDHYQGDFRLVILTGSLFNAVGTVHSDGLKEDNSNNDDAKTVQGNITASFTNAVRRIINDMPQECEVVEMGARIETYATVANELENLSTANVCRKTLIVSGCLQEVSPTFNTTTGIGRRLLANKPDKVMRLLIKKRKLPDKLLGITVYFVYTGNDTDKIQIFHSMTGIYKRLLEDRGARVVIQNTTQNYSP